MTTNSQTTEFTHGLKVGSWEQRERKHCRERDSGKCHFVMRLGFGHCLLRSGDLRKALHHPAGGIEDALKKGEAEKSFCMQLRNPNKQQLRQSPGIQRKLTLPEILGSISDRKEIRGTKVG